MVYRVIVDARPLRDKKAGIGRYVEEMVKSLSKFADIELILVSNRSIVISGDYDKERVIFVYDKFWNFLPGTFWYIFRVPFFARRYKANIVWGTQHALPFWKVRGVKYIVTWHDLVFAFFPETMSFYNRLVMSLVVAKTLKLADHIIAVSETTKKDLLRLYGSVVDEVKVSVIYEGKSLPDDVETNKSLYSVSGDYIFMLGSLEPRKNIVSIIRAFTFIKKRYPEMKLVITGGSGWKNSFIWKEVESSEYKSDIIFTGYLSDIDVVNLMRRCKVFIFPSLYEGFGLPLVEAEGKCPVIVSDIPVFIELGKFFDNLFFCDFSAESEKVANKVIEILEKSPSNLSFKGDAKEIFSWVYAAEKLKKVFEKVIYE